MKCRRTRPCFPSTRSTTPSPSGATGIRSFKGVANSACRRRAGRSHAGAAERCRSRWPWMTPEPSARVRRGTFELSRAQYLGGRAWSGRRLACSRIVVAGELVFHGFAG
jgi:hypothetical protein